MPQSAALPADPPKDNRDPFCNAGFQEFLTTKKTQPSQGASTAETVYSEYVKELASAQDSKRAAIESKAGSVVTASSGLVTLVFAFTAVAAGATPHRLPSSAKDWLAAAIVGFVISGVLAIAVTVPQPVRALDPEVMAVELWDRWDKTADVPIEKVTATRLAQWAATWKLTQRKAMFLSGAYGAQVIAVACLATGALIIWLCRPRHVSTAECAQSRRALGRQARTTTTGIWPRWARYVQ
jgi:hypothetical protein